MKNTVWLLIGCLLRGVLAETFLEISEKIGNFTFDRCRNFTDELASNEIKNRLKDLYDDLIETNKELLCSQTRYTKFMPTMKQLSIDMKRCFQSKEEKYLPNFMFQGFTAFMEFLCGNRTVEIFFSAQGSDCRKALYAFKRQETMRCTSEVFKIFDEDFILRYEDLCYELESARKCFDGVISSSCPYFVAFNTINSNFFHAVGKSCNAAEVIHFSTVVNVANFLFILRSFVLNIF